jgi:hypothetical protein
VGVFAPDFSAPQLHFFGRPQFSAPPSVLAIH